MVHGHDRQNHVHGAKVEKIGLYRHQRMQAVRSMRIEHPFGIASSAGCIAETRRRSLIELAPWRIIRTSGDELLERFKSAVSGFVPVWSRQQHDLFQCWASIEHVFDDANEIAVRQKEAVLCVLDDI